MTSYFPDINVWLALSDIGHSHHQQAWIWLRTIPDHDRLIFARHTQIGLLRLLTNQAAMSHVVLTLGQAWDAYDQWLADPRVEFHPEPHGVEAAFRAVAAPLSRLPASKFVGDSFLVAFARQSGATLVTFDKALLTYARKSACAALTPA